MFKNALGGGAVVRVLRAGCVLLLACGCVVQPAADESVGSEHLSLVSINGLDMYNGLSGINGLNSTNGLMSANGFNSANGLTSNGLNSANGLTSANGLSSANGLVATNGLNSANGLVATNGLNSANGLSSVNGLSSSNGLGSANGLSAANGLYSTNGLLSTNGLGSVNGLNSVNGLAGWNGLGSFNGFNGANGLNGGSGFVTGNAAPGFVTEVGLSRVGRLAATQALLSTDDGRKLTSYVVRCALPADHAITWQADGGTKYTFDGQVGVAPEWEKQACGVDCQEWVTACLMAHVNLTGKHVQIWMDAESPGIGWGTDPAFPNEEAAFFGNLFAQQPQAYVCRGEDAATNPIVGRLCAGQPGCPYVNPYAGKGECRQWFHCAEHSGEAHDGYTACATPGHVWKHVVTTFKK